MPLRLQLVVSVAIFQVVRSNGDGEDGLCLVREEEDEGSSMVQLQARLGEHRAANAAGHGSQREFSRLKATVRPVLSQQEAHVVQLLGVASSLSAHSADELLYLQKVQASARSELDAARAENARIEAAVAKLRTRGQKLEHQLVMKRRLHARQLSAPLVKEVKAILHTWRIWACIGGLVLVILCAFATSAFIEYDRQKREGLRAPKLRTLVREHCFYPCAVVEEVFDHLSWRMKIGSLLLSIFCSGGFALMWRKHVIQPFLKQVLAYLWIVMFLIFIVVFVLYETWNHMRGRMQTALDVMQQVQDGTEHLLHRMGATPPRDAAAATTTAARTMGDLRSTLVY